MQVPIAQNPVPALPPPPLQGRARALPVGTRPTPATQTMATPCPTTSSQLRPRQATRVRAPHFRFRENNNITAAVTSARFAPLHGLPVGPHPSRPRPFHSSNRALVTSEHRHSAAIAAGFRLRLGGGVPLRLRFARRFTPPALHFSARRPQTEAFAIRPKVVCSFGLPTTEGASSAQIIAALEQ